MGTVGYMSPEQVRGKTADHRSDIFSFGTILYEMVTGKQTFRKPTSAETMTAILKEEPPPISQIAPTSPPGLQRVVHRCLEKSPEQRFQSASDMAFALEALSDSGSTTPLAVTRTWRAGRQSQGNCNRGSGAGGAARRCGDGVFLDAARTSTQGVQFRPAHTRRGTEGLGWDGWVENSCCIWEPLTTGAWRRCPPPAASRKESPYCLREYESPRLVAGRFATSVEDGHGVLNNGPLWSVPVLGASPRRLGDTAGQGGGWSADGKMLAYSNGNNLYMAKADGSEARKLLTVGDSGFVLTPVWSPDGNHLRFTYMAKGDAPVYYMEVALDGTGLHRLLPGWSKPPDSECCAQWTADGKYFVFAARGSNLGPSA